MRTLDLTRSLARPQLGSALLLLSSLFCVHLSDQLKLTSVQIPALVQRATNFWLVCQFELEQATSDQLYSVKWYKQNEEFYRLLQLSVDSSASQQPAHGPAANQQQQYFPQVGVNVLMNASNATHVRLLNASIDSEGTYACEISTQNLSTIRYEREIRVYVLPQARLSISGLKSLYSIGERVELMCSSDLSRPAPALAWFINGHRISETNKWFELETKSSDLNQRYKFNEPTPEVTSPAPDKSNLKRSSSVLKFKLTSDLVNAFSTFTRANLLAAGLGATNSTPEPIALEAKQLADFQANLRNQSKLDARAHHHRTARPTSGAATAAAAAYRPPTRLELRLVCRYKLTEVSDVTFNELLIASSRPQKSPLLGAQSDQDAERNERDETHAAGSELGRKWATSAARDGRGGGRWARASALRVYKSTSNQVIQTKSPASLEELSWALGRPGEQQLGDAACRLGALAATPDEPVIVAAPVPTSAPIGQHSAPDKDDERTNEVLYWQLPRAEQRARRADNTGSGRKPRGSELELRRPVSVNCTTIAGVIEETGGARNVKSSSSYCTDLGARRRSAISGGGGGEHLGAQLAPTDERPAHWWAAPAVGARSSGRRHQTAYLSLGASAHKWLVLRGGNAEVEREQEEPNSGGIGAAAADSSDPIVVGRSRHRVGGGGGDHSALLVQAPPLLEWFINNQEAPESSVSGRWFESAGGASGELGGDANLNAGRRLQRLDSDPQSGATSAATSDTQSAAPAPPLDYAEYFANFDSRPIARHLALNLTLGEHHFSTPDSTLRLRCSSTQAQVLAVDEASAVIVASLGDQVDQSLGSSAWNTPKTANQRKSHSKAHRANGGSYLSRPNQPPSSAMAASSATRAATCALGASLTSLVYLIIRIAAIN